MIQIGDVFIMFGLITMPLAMVGYALFQMSEAIRAFHVEQNDSKEGEP